MRKNVKILGIFSIVNGILCYYLCVNKQRKTPFNMKTIFLAFFALVTLTVHANNGGGEELNSTVKMEIKQINATKLQIVTNLVAQANESYEIQRSYDGKKFSTVAIILGTDETASMPALRMSDVVKAEANAYYRIVKIEGGKQIIMSTANFFSK
jgi:hypothetical protein